MSEGLIFTWFFLLIIVSGVPSLYFLLMKKMASRPWNIKADPDYRPAVSILIPTFNEEKIIDLKLDNLSRLDYPRNLIQTIIVDSASSDNTVSKVLQFAESHPEVSLNVVKENKRSGKSRALDLALKYSTGEVIIVSDADCFWSPDILNKAFPFLADPHVGAVAGQEMLLNPTQSWVTRTEKVYRNNMFQIQLGESKLYSTVQFEGGFGAYKRGSLNGFDCETGADDSGTALEIVKRGVRTIVVPEATFFTYFPSSWRGKIQIKTRRARQFILVLLKCLKNTRGKYLVLPKRITLFESFLVLINPIVFTIFLLVTLLILSQYPILVPLLVFPLLAPTSREYLIEFVQNNLVILLAMMSILVGKRSITWQIAKESREDVNVEILRKERLIG